MAERDAAFEWETEALRTSVRRRAETRRSVEETIEPGWVTIRQAESATGIPVGTLRRWARQGSLPSRSQDTATGSRRLVWLDAVLDRAAALGRTPAPSEGLADSEPNPQPSETQQDPGSTAQPAAETRQDPQSQVRERPAPPPPPRPQPHPPPPVEIPGQQRLVEEPGLNVQDEGIEAPFDDTAGDRPAGSTTGPPAASKLIPPDPPPGTMIVPVDAWNKMLLQLGNLHEAGRELAEARERAAKAETEATFLKERLKEQREKAESASSPAVRPSEPKRRWLWRR